MKENLLENTKKIIENLSFIRLTSYNNSLTEYVYNIKLSETFYPALSLLEITLRNRISNAIDELICKNWLLSEIQERKILNKEEHNKLIEAKNKIEHSGKMLTNDRLISELTLGFWVHLFTKSYKPKLWDKKGVFEKVFPYYVSNKCIRNLTPIQKDLFFILKLRNKIFHHENIINGIKTPQEQYQTIINIIHLMSEDIEILLNRISNFNEIIKQKP